MAATCASTPRERWGRAAGAVVVGGVALGMGDMPWVAVPAGVFALFLLIGAVTGWCPTDLLARPRAQRPNAFGYAQVRPAAVRDAVTGHGTGDRPVGTEGRSVSGR